MMQGIEFDEDKTILSPLESEVKIPDRGFEGWVYRTIPGKYKTKKLVLIWIVLTLFVLSFVFLVMARYNTIVINSSDDFSDKVLKTKIK